MMPRSLDSFWRLQFPLLTQVAQLLLCWDKISSTFVRLTERTLGELVKSTMPSSTGLLQAVISLVFPCISTTHTLQALISLMPSR